MTTKSRPIIMLSDSVRAILDSRKTQTRRVMNPLYMPSEASRLTLEITNVRCERVQEITCDDVIAEGYGRGINYIQAEIAFADAWDKLNAKRGYGWDANPWVWVIEFKKIEGGDNE